MRGGSILSDDAGIGCSLLANAYRLCICGCGRVLRGGNRYATYDCGVRIKKKSKDPDDIAMQEIVRRDPCAYCGAPKGGYCDHIEPYGTGGRDRWDNVTGACMTCNASKSDLPFLYWFLNSEIGPRGRTRWWV
jgi:5-methylcytosine-specific restriction endonuclease McrA